MLYEALGAPARSHASCSIGDGTGGALASCAEMLVGCDAGVMLVGCDAGVVHAGAAGGASDEPSEPVEPRRGKSSSEAAVCG